MELNIEDLIVPPPAEAENYKAPETHYFKLKEEFNKAVGRDFIKSANEGTRKGKPFLVGLSHGQSPSGVYSYILSHYNDLNRPELIRYTFVNSKLKRQRGLEEVTDATAFLKRLLRTEKITKDQIIGRSLNRDDVVAYCEGLNVKMSAYLEEQEKQGLDYMFAATNPKGQVAGVTRFSEAFGSDEISAVVKDGSEFEITLTPTFILKTKRIAFLATKAEKRRALAWLFYRWGKPNESPSFLRYMDNVTDRLIVFVDDQALTWPQITVTRETPYGDTNIRIDLATPFSERAKNKRPVVLLVHGFLGLNSFDGLLAAIPSRKYIAAAMHYGSIPNDLPPELYSQHVMENIDSVIEFFGKKGHPVYLFDHSMGNIYFLMMDHSFNQLNGAKNYLKGRIGANPFFGKEAKHALLGFMDNVILKASLGIAERTMFLGARTVIPWDTKAGVRRRAITMTDWLISSDSTLRDRIWKSVKQRILYLMSNLDSIPRLNRIPIQRALNRLPAKVFAIQIHSALIASKIFDKQKALANLPKHNIPVLILKSKKDIVAKFDSSIYENNPLTNIIDVTDYGEKELFREHLYHMTNPQTTTNIIDEFICKCEKLAQKKTENLEVEMV